MSEYYSNAWYANNPGKLPPTDPEYSARTRRTLFGIVATGAAVVALAWGALSERSSDRPDHDVCAPAAMTSQDETDRYELIAPQLDDQELAALAQPGVAELPCDLLDPRQDY